MLMQQSKKREHLYFEWGWKFEWKAVCADTPVKLSSSLTSLLEFLLSLKEFMSADLSDRRSQRGDSGNTPGMLQESKDKT